MNSGSAFGLSGEPAKGAPARIDWSGTANDWIPGPGDRDAVEDLRDFMDVRQFLDDGSTVAVGVAAARNEDYGDAVVSDPDWEPADVTPPVTVDAPPKAGRAKRRSWIQAVPEGELDFGPVDWGSSRLLMQRHEVIDEHLTMMLMNLQTGWRHWLGARRISSDLVLFSEVNETGSPAFDIVVEPVVVKLDLMPRVPSDLTFHAIATTLDRNTIDSLDLATRTSLTPMALLVDTRREAAPGTWVVRVDHDEVTRVVQLNVRVAKGKQSRAVANTNKDLIAPCVDRNAGVVASGHAAAQIPARTQTRPAVDPAPLPDTEHELAAAHSRIAALESDVRDLRRLNTSLHRELAQVRIAADESETPGEPAPACDEAVEQPAHTCILEPAQWTVSAVLDHARAHLPGVLIGGHVTEQGLDRDGKAAVWAQRLWRLLCDFDRYVESGTSTSLRDWYRSNGSSSVRVSFHESETVKSRAKTSAERTFPVPAEVDPSGRALFVAHGRVDAGGRGMSPRIYFRDEKAAVGQVIIGYVGPHLTNTKTN